MVRTGQDLRSGGGDSKTKRIFFILLCVQQKKLLKLQTE